LGVEVVLLKRDAGNLYPRGTGYDQPREDNISTTKGLSGLAPNSIAKKAVAAVSAGEIREHRFGLIQKQLALGMFPDAPSEGVALARFFETAVGKTTLASRPKLSPNQNYALAKAEAGHDGEDDDGGDEHANYGQSPAYAHLKRLAAAHRLTPEGKGMSIEQAFTHICTKTDEGRELLAKDKAWHQNVRRSQIAQERAGV
jgi:hypothetical protein